MDAAVLRNRTFDELRVRDAAGLVLGARVPIVLTSRADSRRARLASAALAKLAKVPQPLKELAA